MGDETDHDECVNAWMERAARGMPPDRLLHAFEAAFAAMWRRAHVTLGDVTLTAIVDRVLRAASERYPIVAALQVDETGLRCDGLRERAVGPSRQGSELEQAVRFVLTEFLTVLGNLTDEILTPALHDELSSAAPEVGISASRRGTNP